MESDIKLIRLSIFTINGLSIFLFVKLVRKFGFEARNTVNCFGPNSIQFYRLQQKPKTFSLDDWHLKNHQLNISLFSAASLKFLIRLLKPS